MPKLDSYKTNIAANNQLRTVRNAQAKDVSIGEGLSAIGEALERVEEVRGQNELARIEVDARRQMDALYREIEQDGEGNYQEFDGRLTKGSAKIKEDLIKSAKTSFARQAIKLRFGDIETAYVLKTRDLQRKRATETAVAEFTASFAALEDTAKDVRVPIFDEDNPDARSFRRELEATQAQLNSLKRGGFIGADAAEELQIKMDDITVGATSARHVRDITDKLDKEDYLRAEDMLLENWNEITPEARETLKTTIEDMRESGEVFDLADSIWDQAKGNFGDAMELARQEERPSMREKVTAELIARANQEDKAKNAEQEEVGTQGLDYLQRGVKIPATVYAAADSRTRQFWDDWKYQQKQREASLRHMDAETKAALAALDKINQNSVSTMAVRNPDLYLLGPRAWMTQDPDLYEKYKALPPDDRSKIDLDIVTRRESGGTATEVDSVYTRLSDQAKRQVPDFAKALRNGVDWAVELDASLWASAEEESAYLGGGEIKLDRVKQLVGSAAAKTRIAPDFPESLWKGPQPITDVDPETLAAGDAESRKRQALKIATANPLAWRAAKRMMADEGIDNPSEYEIAQRVLEEMRTLAPPYELDMGDE
jgi:hypothetical protein